MAKNITTERQTELDFLTSIGTSALAALPEHTFKSQSVGRNATGRVTIDGTEYSVFVTVVNRATVVKAEPVAAEPVAEPVKAATKPRTRKTAAERKAAQTVAA